MKRVATAAAIVLLCACASERPFINGGALLNVQPASQPGMVGTYDFDLLGPVRGKACLKESAPFERKTEYWIGALPFNGTPPRDPLTLGAIAAASTDAIDKIVGADTIVLTRVLTEGNAKEVCAYVYGRAVRLKKAGEEPDEPDANDDATSESSENSDSSE